MGQLKDDSWFPLLSVSSKLAAAAVHLLLLLFLLLLLAARNRFRAPLYTLGPARQARRRGRGWRLNQLEEIEQVVGGFFEESQISRRT